MNEPAETSDEFALAYAGLIDFLPLDLPPYAPIISAREEDGDAPTPVVNKVVRNDRQTQLKAILADTFYGPIPPPPDKLDVLREPMASEPAERLQIEISYADKTFNVDAALWLPANTNGPVPLICGLDFIGPVGIMSSTEFPIDKNARVSSRLDYGASDNRIEETLRGVCAYRWPVSMLLDAGYAVLVSCYGSWVPDDERVWKNHGLYPLLIGTNEPSPDKHSTSAISLWAWAIQRLLDVATTCDEIDMSRVCVAGHSRLGKSALWAAANDKRINTVFANQSGCGGAAPAAHAVGETLAQMHARFPHWTLPPLDSGMAALPFDQHHLLSLIAPREVYLGAARSDLWSDPVGSYLALKAAAPVWHTEQSQGCTWPSPQDLWQSTKQVCNGPLGYHLRPGGHDLLPFDWRQFLKFRTAT